MATRNAFTLLETIIVIVIISLLATFVIIQISNIRKNARDLKRKSDISQLGRFLTLACYLPDAGSGIYDLTELLSELQAKDERYRQAFNLYNWRDPLASSSGPSGYYYQVTDNKLCVIYANLEKNPSNIDLNNLNQVTPGGGQGTLASTTPGLNGTNFYYQYSN